VASFTSGRDAALARRRALSAGKAAMPPAQERTRAGFRDARLPGAPLSAAPLSSAPVSAAHVSAAPPGAPAPDAAPQAATPAAGPALSGRTASMVRRRMLSAGKASLQTGAAAYVAPPATQPVARGGQLDYAPKVVASTTQKGVCVTGSRIGRGQQVTGDERGTLMPVSGTQYIDAQTGGAWRASGSKVGQALTGAGLVVSGTLVRSAVRITGDERGDQSRITGKVDARPSDDLTARPSEGAAVSAQFQRQVNPHGGGTFAGNLGRSARQVGSRQRANAPLLEATEGGAPITGSAVGRSLRVTGDEGGACRPISGSQYLAPARRETACGGVGGGTAPAVHLGTDRPDPVTLSKVAVSATWGGQRVTGIDVEHNKRVTGDAPGTCAALTGSQYQGPATIDGACATDAAKSATARRMLARARLPVTGDTPVLAQAVSGLNRGASRDITGTPYYRPANAEQPAAPAPSDPVAALDAQFSIRSPQRAAQLCQARPAEGEAGRITGSFAVGTGKVTGNFEFTGKSRALAAKDSKPAHARVSGEGNANGPAITGDSWASKSRVTGTEGPFACSRNPSERGEKAKPFAGATLFKAQSAHGEPRQLVTGMSGSSAKTGARVTLSGGAQS
jgi:hypothetical protein